MTYQTLSKIIIYFHVGKDALDYVIKMSKSFTFSTNCFCCYCNIEHSFLFIPPNKMGIDIRLIIFLLKINFLAF